VLGVPIRGHYPAGWPWGCGWHHYSTMQLPQLLGINVAFLTSEFSVTPQTFEI